MRPCIQSFCTDHRRSTYVFGQIAGIATGADPNLTEEAAALLRHRQQHTGAEISRCVSPLQQILPGNLFFPLPEGLPPPPLLPHHYFDYSLYLAFLSAFDDADCFLLDNFSALLVPSSVSNYERSLQAYELACPLHGCWQKTGDSWVRDQGLCYSSPSRQHEFHVCNSFPCPPTLPSAGGKMMWGWIQVGFTPSWSVPSLGIPTLRKPQSFIITFVI